MSPTSKVGYDRDHEAFRSAVHALLAAELRPRLDEFRTNGAVSADVYAAAGRSGFLGMGVPEEFGGGGVDDPRFVAVLLEEAVATGAIGFAQVLANHVGVCIPALLRFSTSKQRDALLSDAASGVALAAPVFGVEAGVPRFGVPAAAQASIFVLDVWKDSAPVGTLAVSGGVATDPVYDFLGGRESGAADVTVSGDLLVAELAPSQHEVMRRDADLWNAALAVGATRRAITLTIDYVSQRKAFGNLIADFENTRYRMAEVAAELGSVTAFLAECLDRHASGVLNPVAAASLRWVATRVHDHAVDQGIQLHGGYGYMREYEIAHAFADARFVSAVAGGVSDPRELVAAGLFA